MEELNRAKLYWKAVGISILIIITSWILDYFIPIQSINWRYMIFPFLLIAILQTNVDGGRKKLLGGFIISLIVYEVGLAFFIYDWLLIKAVKEKKIESLNPPVKDIGNTKQTVSFFLATMLILIFTLIRVVANAVKHLPEINT